MGEGFHLKEGSMEFQVDLSEDEEPMEEGEDVEREHGEDETKVGWDEVEEEDGEDHWEGECRWTMGSEIHSSFSP